MQRRWRHDHGRHPLQSAERWPMRSIVVADRERRHRPDCRAGSGDPLLYLRSIFSFCYSWHRSRNERATLDPAGQAVWATRDHEAACAGKGALRASRCSAEVLFCCGRFRYVSVSDWSKRGGLADERPLQRPASEFSGGWSTPARLRPACGALPLGAITATRA